MRLTQREVVFIFQRANISEKNCAMALSLLVFLPFLSFYRQKLSKLPF